MERGETKESPAARQAADGPRSPYLAICYLTSHAACNLSCPYCIGSWKPAPGAAGDAAPRAVLDRVQAIPRPVNLILTQWGEFFTSRPLMEETTRLCNAPGNLVGVSVLTNLQAGWDRTIRPFVEGLDTTRLAMGCTLHDRVITARDVDRFFEKAGRLRERGVLVYVNYILSGPDGIARARAHKSRCEALGVPLTLMPLFPSKPGAGDPGSADFFRGMTSWSAGELREIEPLCDSPHTYRTYFDARTPLGMRCGAGRDYLYIDAAGDVYPCCGKRDSPLGNILRDEIAFREEDAVCGCVFCLRPYEMSALRIVDRRYTRDRDFRLIHQREGLPAEVLESGYGMPLRLWREASRLAPGHAATVPDM